MPDPARYARRVAGAAGLAMVFAAAGYSAWATGPLASQDRGAEPPPAPGADTAQPSATELPKTINLTNAGTGRVLTWGSRRLSRAEIQTAIEAGRVADVYAGGGSASDVLAAIFHEDRAWLDNPRAPKPVPGTAQFAMDTVSNYFGVTFIDETGDRIFPTSPQIVRTGTPPPNTPEYHELLGLTREQFSAGMKSLKVMPLPKK